MYCECDNETYDIYDSIERKSRKVKKCCECSVAINVGDYYQDCRGLFESNWYSLPTCIRCNDLRDSLSALGMGIPNEKLIEYYQYYLDDIGSDKKANDILRGKL